MKTGLGKLYGPVIFVGALLVLVVQNFLIKIYGPESGTGITLIDDFVYFAFLAVLIPLSYRLYENKYALYTLYAFAGFILFGIVSAYVGKFSTTAYHVFFQILLDAKLIVFVFALYLFTPSEKTIKQFDLVLKFILIAGIPLCIFQYLKPDLFVSYFASERDGEPFIAGSVELPRLAGFFPIAGYTAFFTSITALYFLYIRKNTFFLVLSLLQLVLSFQRQETVTFLLLLFCINLFGSKQNKNKFILISLAAGLVIMLFFSQILSYGRDMLESMSLANIKYSEEPRTLVYYYGIVLAVNYFPFGVGFGNYGGFAAEKFDSSLYYQLNFHQLDWFKEKDYLTDTYYPHLFAESGLIGFAFYIACLICIYKLFRSQVILPENQRIVSFLFLFLIIVAISSPVLNNPFALCLLGFVLAINRKKDILDRKSWRKERSVAAI